MFYASVGVHSALFYTASDQEFLIISDKGRSEQYRGNYKSNTKYAADKVRA